MTEAERAFTEVHESLIVAVNAMERSLRQLRRGDVAKAKETIKAAYRECKKVCDDDEYASLVLRLAQEQ